jgi:hypothetical protein
MFAITQHELLLLLQYGKKDLTGLELGGQCTVFRNAGFQLCQHCDLRDSIQMDRPPREV